MDEESIFLAALEKETPREREAYLDDACAGRADLRRGVELLLRAHERAGPFLRAGPGGLTADRPGREGPGTVLGPYKLLQSIGEGGMGAVWMAEQTHPVRRTVALKVIKPGMDSGQVLARFEAERQALALMDHPHIAKVLDAGATEAGRPFFVMELVKGVPITQYCDERRLTVRQRLGLFVPVCQAVQHAHGKGIIHRDLKPSNVLVAPYDGAPVPKVIDFGVAKAAGPRLTERTLYTGFGQVVGTLEYMSPEQAELNNLDVDTRSDVYALGVLLYELLTGTTPLERRRLGGASLLEALRLIREEDPPKPSTRLGTTEQAPAVAAARGLEPWKLRGLVRGELDWIVMRCLEKDRNRRYETASGLARDLQRYLADEPVQACPPSAAYRLGKFGRRHRVLVGGTAAVVLVAVAVVGLVLTLQARANANLADKNILLAEEQAKAQARFELAQKAIALFHTGVSEDLLLKNAEFKELRTKLLQEAAGFYADLEKLLAGQTDAKSRKALAAAYFQLGELTDKIGDREEALAVHRKALALRRELAAAEGADVEARLDVARSLDKVGLLLRATGDTTAALAVLEEQRDLAERLEAEHPSDAVRSVLARSHNSIGLVHTYLRKPAEALSAYRKALAIRQKLADANPAVTEFHRDLATNHHSIGDVLLWQTGSLGEAMVSYRKALTIRQKLADASPAAAGLQRDLATTHNSIGSLLRSTAKPEEALTEYGKALAIRQKAADASPAVTGLQLLLAGSHCNMGMALKDMGKPEESLTAWRKALAIQQKVADASPAEADVQQGLAHTYGNIGVLLLRTGRPEEAMASYLEALALFQKLADANPGVTPLQSDLAKAHSFIGDTLAKTGKPEEAMKADLKALAILQKLVDASPTDPRYQGEQARVHDQLGRLLAHQKQFAEAFTHIDAGLVMRQKLVEAIPKDTECTTELGHSHASRGWALVRFGQPSKAAADLRRAVELWAKDPALDPETRFERSRALALLSGLGRDAKSGVTKAEATAFADQAVAALRDAFSAGWGWPNQLKEPDFDTLRGRDDFKKLLRDLQVKAMGR
jgi:serine/threonine protein kinase/tetratricopeptide (TPR) repeat protein